MHEIIRTLKSKFGDWWRPIRRKYFKKNAPHFTLKVDDTYQGHQAREEKPNG